MKELKKLFSVYYENLNISSKIQYNNESIIFGKDLSKENNTEFNFLYKGDNCRVLLEGKGEKIDALVLVLKATFNYTDSQTIKDKNDYVLKTLLGICGSENLTKKYNIDYSSCVVIALFCENSSKEIASFLPIYTSCIAVEVSKDLCVLIKSTNSEKEDYLSLSKFAKILNMAIEEELGKIAYIGIGSPVDKFEEINASFIQAKLALDFGKANNRKVYSYLEVLPKKMLSSLSNKEKNYFLKPFGILLKNKELLNSAKEFLNCDLNINLASQKLFIHRNTLIYRLNKIEKLVGLDLRNFNDAVTFRLVCLLNETKGDINE